MGGLSIPLLVSYKGAVARDVKTILSDMRANPAGIRFDEACKVADHFFGAFGAPRNVGSHRIYKMPWPGDPRINLQKDGARAKRYQVVQMLAAVDKFQALKAAEAVTTKATVKDVPRKKRR